MANITKEQDGLIPVEEYRKNFKKNTKGKKEEKVQLAICDYIRNAYPEVIFTCDLASGLRLPIWLGALHKKMRSSRGLPDLFIAQPRWISGSAHHHGLFLEIKKEGVVVRLKNGELPADKHIREQAVILDKLRALGFCAAFVCGFEEAKKIIDGYLK